MHEHTNQHWTNQEVLSVLIFFAAQSLPKLKHLQVIYGYIFLLLPAPENLPTASLQDSVRRIGHSRRDKEKRTSNASGIQHL